ncbi:HNH endonuclease [Frankia sp. AiPs1]|uniref:HNH endonuclease n=1 Tax=Frankia sp. AiPs1 TaxID=573493 RepID=UPI0035AC0A61
MMNASLAARPTAATSTPETGNGAKTCPRCNRQHYAWSQTCDRCRYNALSPDERQIRRRAKWLARRQRISAGGSRVTPAELREIRKSGSCTYCDEASTETDHIWPLSRGGPDTPDNIVPACSRCNRSKGTKLLTEWQRGRVEQGLLASEKIKDEIIRLTWLAADPAP